MGRDLLRRTLLTAGLFMATLVLMGAAIIGAYLLDTRDGPRTIRGLHIHDQPSGDLTPAGIDRVLSRLDNELGGSQIRIRLPEESHRLTAADLGVSLDTERMKDLAFRVGDSDSTWGRFRNWMGSFTAVRRMPLLMQIDRERAETTIRRLDGLVLEEATDPRLVLGSDGQLIVREGTPGTQVDVVGLVDQLERGVGDRDLPDAEGKTVPLPPALDASEVAEVAQELNRLTSGGIEVRLEDEKRQLSATALRIRLDTHEVDGRARPEFDLESLQNLIEQTFRDIESGGTDPVFEIVDDQPELVEEGRPPLECCQDDAAQTVAEAVLGERPNPVRVEARPSEDPKLVEWARGEDVVEKVSEFTTEHSCCQGRVSNIQRFADIVRGVYLVPGEVLSLNDHVGQRTTEKGFVPAGTIIRGHLVPTVGGGVSQFATTIFNAAFFAGFDFPEYQSHSIYFSRYPYGREATISWPAPDLEIQNTTDHPALIWTSYTDTSITVSIYSTKHVEVEQTGQETSPARACTRVDTYRLRTYEDGREVEDSVFATYRPDEGRDCNGNPTDRPNL